MHFWETRTHGLDEAKKHDALETHQLEHPSARFHQEFCPCVESDNGDEADGDAQSLNKRDPYVSKPWLHRAGAVSPSSLGGFQNHDCECLRDWILKDHDPTSPGPIALVILQPPFCCPVHRLEHAISILRVGSHELDV